MLVQAIVTNASEMQVPQHGVAIHADRLYLICSSFWNNGGFTCSLTLK